MAKCTPAPLLPSIALRTSEAPVRSRRRTSVFCNKFDSGQEFESDPAGEGVGCIPAADVTVTAAAAAAAGGISNRASRVVFSLEEAISVCTGNAVCSANGSTPGDTVDDVDAPTCTSAAVAAVAAVATVAAVAQREEGYFGCAGVLVHNPSPVGLGTVCSKDRRAAA